MFRQRPDSLRTALDHGVMRIDRPAGSLPESTQAQRSTTARSGMLNRVSLQDDRLSPQSPLKLCRSLHGRLAVRRDQRSVPRFARLSFSMSKKSALFSKHAKWALCSAQMSNLYQTHVAKNRAFGVWRAQMTNAQNAETARVQDPARLCATRTVEPWGFEPPCCSSKR